MWLVGNEFIVSIIIICLKTKPAYACVNGPWRLAKMNVKVNTATGVGFSAVSILHSHDRVKFGKRHGRLSLPIRLGVLSVFFITFFGSVMSMKTRSIQYTAHSGPLNHVPWMAISLERMVTPEADKSCLSRKNLWPLLFSQPSFSHTLLPPYGRKGAHALPPSKRKGHTPESKKECAALSSHLSV